MNESANAFRAGLVVIAAVAIGVYFFASSRKSTLDASNSDSYYALLTDASGLNAKSLITVSGLQVGEIQNVELVPTTVGELIPDPEQRSLDVRPALPELNHEGTLVRWTKAKGDRVARGDVVAVIKLDDRAGTEIEVVSPAVGDLYALDIPEGVRVHGSSVLGRVAENPDKRIQVAKVSMRIIRDVRIPNDTWLKKESLGLLGAKALFMELGTDAEHVAPGGRIMNVRSQTGLDAIQGELEQVAQSVKSIVAQVEKNVGGITADVKGITGVLNRFIQGDENTMPVDELYDMLMGEIRDTVVAVQKAVKQVNSLVGKNDQAVSHLIANLESISNDVAELTGPKGEGGQGGGEIRETMASVRKITDDLAVVTASLKDIVGENEDEFGTQVKSLKHTIAELNRSLTSVSEIAGRVERGEGTVGRLLTDEKMADKLEDAVSGASDFVTGLTAIETHIDLGTWYSLRRGQSNVALGLRLQPKPDKYYLIEVVDDGGGIERLTQIIDSTYQTNVGTAFVRREAIYQDDNSIRITANFAKMFFDFLVLRAGIIETSGGVGADIFLFDNRVQLRTDLYNFGGPRNRISSVDPRYPGIALPRWRTMLKAQPIPHVYFLAGIDDALNVIDYDQALQNGSLSLRNPAFHGYGVDFLVGVGITFKDDDLRSILPLIPSF